MCYSCGSDEGVAVRETVAVMKTTGLAPLEISSYGSLRERLEEGHEISREERELMLRAVDENSVIVAQLTPFFDD